MFQLLDSSSLKWVRSWHKRYTDYWVLLNTLYKCTFLVYTLCPRKKETKTLYVISPIKLGRFSWNLVHRFLNKFASEWLNVSHLTLVMSLHYSGVSRIVLGGFMLGKDIESSKRWRRWGAGLDTPSKNIYKLFAGNAIICCIFTSFEEIFNI